MPEREREHIQLILMQRCDQSSDVSGVACDDIVQTILLYFMHTFWAHRARILAMTDSYELEQSFILATALMPNNRFLWMCQWHLM